MFVRKIVRIILHWRGIILQPCRGPAVSDIDECAVDNGGCDQFCKNTIGSFDCSCSIGYTLSRNQQHCSDVNECDVVTSNRVCLTSEICANTLGSYACLSKQIAYIPYEAGEILWIIVFTLINFLVYVVTDPRSLVPNCVVAVVEESTQKWSRILQSREMFIAMLVWSGVVTLLMIATLMLMWCTEDTSLRRLRDAQEIEERCGVVHSMCFVSLYAKLTCCFSCIRLVQTCICEISVP